RFIVAFVMGAAVLATGCLVAFSPRPLSLLSPYAWYVLASETLVTGALTASEIGRIRRTPATQGRVLLDWLLALGVVFTTQLLFLDAIWGPTVRIQTALYVATTLHTVLALRGLWWPLETRHLLPLDSLAVDSTATPPARRSRLEAARHLASRLF